MKFTKKERSEARREIQEAINQDFNCYLLATDESFVFGGTPIENVCLICSAIEMALEDERIPKNMLINAVKLAIEKNGENSESENVRKKIDKAILDILDEMKKSLEKNK